MVIFEWDQAKAQANLRKHDVSFEEGESVFYDPESLTIAGSQAFRQGISVYRHRDFESEQGIGCCVY